uniref:Uncharacterized protein n=1 Tax=Strongyloides stercoralis TaxID=6248 RepID=A0AAF5DQ74_STRER
MEPSKVNKEESSKINNDENSFVTEEINKKKNETKSDFFKRKLILQPRKSIKKIGKFKNWKIKEKKGNFDKEEESKKIEYYFVQNLNSFRDISKKMFKEVNDSSNDNDNKLENHVSFSYLVQI